MLSLNTRLKCENSYATEDTPDLLCHLGMKCDGRLYDDCVESCRSMTEAMAMIMEYEKGNENDKRI